MKFLITAYQDEYEMFIAECPSIPGCVSQGKTETEGYRYMERSKVTSALLLTAIISVLILAFLFLDLEVNNIQENYGKQVFIVTLKQVEW